MIIKTNSGRLYFCNEGKEIDTLKEMIQDELGMDSKMLLENFLMGALEEIRQGLMLAEAEKEELEKEVDGWVIELRNVKDELDGIIENDKLTKKSIIDSLYRLSHKIYSML